MKMSAWLLGGYLLGRTKKGGMALRLATSLATSGQQGRPGELARENLMRMVQSAETEQLIQGLRGQLTQAMQAVLDARVAQLAQTLTDRTEALTSSATQTADKAQDTVKGVIGSDSDSDEEQDSGAVEGSRTHAEEEPAEESEEAEPETSDEFQERVDELKGLRITSLRKMAKELRFEEEGIADAAKDDLAVWIAEAEAEDDEYEEAEDEEEAEKPSRRQREKAGSR
jgi:transglutaminase/protease-like cytokinesis protein 3